MVALGDVAYSVAYSCRLLCHVVEEGVGVLFLMMLGP